MGEGAIPPGTDVRYRVAVDRVGDPEPLVWDRTGERSYPIEAPPPAGAYQIRVMLTSATGRIFARATAVLDVP